MRSEAPLASELLLVVALLAPEGCRCAGRLEQASQSRRAGAVLVGEGDTYNIEQANLNGA